MEDNNFKEIIKQMNYQEWRQRKAIKRHEVLIDPQSPIWNYVDGVNPLSYTDKKTFDLSCDELLWQIEKTQNVLFITLKRRRKTKVGSSEWNTFTDKINQINLKISELSELLNEKMYGKKDNKGNGEEKQ